MNAYKLQLVRLKVHKLAHVEVAVIGVSEVNRDSLHLVTAGDFQLVSLSC